MERGNRLLGHVLTPVGLAIISISLVGATRLYDLIPVEVGLLVALLSAVAAAVIAVRANSQTVAAFGLVSVLLAPPLMGATPGHGHARLHRRRAGRHDRRRALAIVVVAPADGIPPGRAAGRVLGHGRSGTRPGPAGHGALLAAQHRRRGWRSVPPAPR